MKNKGYFLKKIKSTLLMCMFAISGLIAQTEKIAFEKYGIAEGLPEEVGRNFVQDKQGYIWIGTQNGLAKFNGYEMHVYRANPDNPNGLQLRNLNGGLLIASDNKLWIGGVSLSGGLSSYDPISETFTNHDIDFADPNKVPYQNNFVLFEDVVQNIWFTSLANREGFLCKIDPDTQKVTRYPYLVGIKNNDIVLNFAIAESKKDSSIWLNNDNKILRYDRQKDLFELQFKAGDIIPGTAFRDTIVDINSDSKGGLITMTNNNRMFLFDPHLRKVIETYEFKNRSDISWGAQFEDHHGNFWVSSHDNLTRINRELGHREDFKFGVGVLNFKMNGNVLQIVPEVHNEDFILFEVTTTDSNNERFIYTLRYDFNSKSFELFNYQFNDEKNQFVDNNNTAKYVIDKTGLLWVGTRPNIYKQSPKTRQIEHYKHNEKDKSSLPSDIVTALFEDSKQQLWVGTTDGIAIKQANGSFKTIGWFGHGETGKSIGSVDEIIEDSSDVIWVGTQTGLYRWNASSKLFEKLLTILGENLNVTTLIEDDKNRIWISIWNRGIYVLDKKSGNILTKFESNNSENHQLTSTTISSIYLDLKNRIWVGDPLDNEIGLFRYIENEHKFTHYNYQINDSTSISSNEIHFLTEDDQGRIWVGTDGGLNMYDSQKDIFIRNNDVVNIPSTNTHIKANNGKMWIVAYSGGGLAQVGPAINDVTTYGEEKGLLHNDANSMVFDNLGKLWLPTERGLSVFDTLTKTYTSYFEKDGFQKYGRFNSALKTKNGDIWIGGLDGLNHITPSSLSKKDATLPSVYITKMGIMDSIYSAPDGDIFTKAVSYTDEVRLNHWQKDLSFNFVGIHFLRPEDNQYSYKLENYDNNWSTPSKERRAAYTNLSPGTYIFHVKSSNADGIWNEEGATIKVIISPPWWLTWWAYVIYALILGLIGVQIHKSQRARTLRHAREEAQQKELEQAKEIEKAYTELKSTQAQLIQSEKMASLGELTAGIAHEIQNPLNFVNNFAEVNSELIEEMKEEIDNGNLEEVKNLADDINDNEKKIIFHGKRADSIVKGMLQHSRISNGKKEPTDINALTDEYFRLAYHGLRAKDKSFNATMISDFDDNVEKVNIIPQEIGRVILNLITNAFYVVDEKKKSGIKNYEPTVKVRTKNERENVIIQVTDNGNGIPEHIISKIFEPFFTTKPTGKGTGLGLSMSYDIITNSHGGELKVDTKEGEGTTFTITLVK